MRIRKSIAPAAARIPNIRRNKNIEPIYELRLTNGIERTFNTWDEFINFMNFPPERGPELFTMLFTNRGEWVDFTDEDDSTENDEALNTPILYVCELCNKYESLTPIQAIKTRCTCSGMWSLVDITQYMPEERRSEKKVYDI